MENSIKKNLVDPVAFIRSSAAITIFVLHTHIFSNMHGYVINEGNWFMKTAAHGAVWTFFFLSGYFNIRGFLGREPKYSLDLHGLKEFYIKRFIKVLFPVWCFYLIALTISEPAFLHIYPETIWRLLTFTYSGEPGCTSIAATWYVSTLAGLYLLTPLFAWICRKLERSKGCVLVIAVSFIVVLLGFIERFFLLLNAADWTQGVFVPVYCNLDVYFCGGVAYLIARKIKLPLSAAVSYALSIIVYTLLLILHSRIYYLGDIDGKYIILHGYIMPSVYILVLSVVCIFIQNAGYQYMPVDCRTVRRNPFRLIDAFSLISFQFYLVHSMVLFHLSSYVTGADGAIYNRKMILYGFCISVPLSILFKRATAFNVPKGPISRKNDRAVLTETAEDAGTGDTNERAD